MRLAKKVPGNDWMKEGESLGASFYARASNPAEEVPFVVAKALERRLRGTESQRSYHPGRRRLCQVGKKRPGLSNSIVSDRPSFLETRILARAQ